MTEEQDIQEKRALTRHRFFTTWTVIGILLILGVIGYCLKVLALPVAILIWTLIIVFCLRGLVNWLEVHGLRRGLGTTIAYIVMLAIIALVIFVLTSPTIGMGGQLAEIADSIPSFISATTTWFNDVTSGLIPAQQYQIVAGAFNAAISSAGDALSTIASGSASALVSITSSLLNGAISFIIAMIISFWLLMQLPRIGREMERIVPDSRREELELWSVAFTRVMSGYIKALLLQCCVIGLLCGFAFAFIGIPSPAAMGVIVGLLNIIPFIGPYLGGIAAAIASIMVGPVTFVVTIVVVIVLQFVVLRVVSPKIMANNVDIHPAITILGMIIGMVIGAAMGGAAAAVAGMFLAIPILAMAKSMFVYYYERSTGKRIVSPDGVFFQGDAKEDDPFDPAADATAPIPAPEMQNTTGKLKKLVLGTKDEESEEDEEEVDPFEPKS